MSPTLTKELADAVVTFEDLPHRRTATAREEATVVGVRESDVAKTVVFVSADGFVRAVVPASERVDIHKLSEVVGGRVRLATEKELARAYPMFELGAVPPFGGPDGDAVVFDPTIAERAWIVLDAGSHRRSIRLKVSDLRILAPARVADICTS